MRIQFSDGDRVRLKPNEKEGWPEEFGNILEDVDTDDPEELVIVRVEAQYQGRGDDGLRELSLDQLEKA